MPPVDRGKLVLSWFGKLTSSLFATTQILSNSCRDNQKLPRAFFLRKFPIFDWVTASLNSSY